MERNIKVEKLEAVPIEQQAIELVERKGIGHPDYICDACCEAASQALSAYYIKYFGSVLHHNLDKGLLIAGKAQPKFGGGKILEPIKLIIAGRATDSVEAKKIPVREIATKAAQAWLSKQLQIEPAKLFEIQVEYKPGAAALLEVFKRAKHVALANDTSFGIAHAPLSRTERLTLETANLLNSTASAKKFPALGKDIKVMALRRNNKVSLTIGAAFIDKYIDSASSYVEQKAKLREWLLSKIAHKAQQQGLELSLTINALDAPQPKSEKDIYLTVSGLSAEHGDDGNVGRSNRPNGLITPGRPMSLEATAGKNINHPGKLYQVLALIIAEKIAKLPEVEECVVKLLSQIGAPLDQPQIAAIALRADKFEAASKEAVQIVNEVLDKLPKLQLEIAAGKYKLF